MAIKVIRTLRIEHWLCNQCGVLVIENLTPREDMGAMLCPDCLLHPRSETAVVDGSPLGHFTNAREADDEPGVVIFRSASLRTGVMTNNFFAAELYTCTSSCLHNRSSTAILGQSESEQGALVDIAPIIQGRMSSIGESATIDENTLTTLTTMYFIFIKIVSIGMQQSRRHTRQLLENGQVRVREGPINGDKRQFFVNDRVVQVQISFRFKGNGLRGIWWLLQDFASHFFEPELLQLEHLLSHSSDVYRFADISIDALIALPTYLITNEHRALQTASCAICLDDFKVGVLVLGMPCQHVYHQDCIFRWLTVRNSCPFCRFQMPSDALLTSQ